MKPEIHLDHIGVSEFSSQMKNPVSKLFLSNKCFLYVFLYPKVPPILQICSKYIHNVLFSALSLSFSKFQQSAKSGKNALSFCNLNTGLHLLNCNRSDFNESQSTTQRVFFLCVGGDGLIWVKWAVTKAPWS